MSKRDKKTITIGSAVPYIMPYADELPTVEEICKDEYLLGYIKSGAAVEYTEESYTEKDDLGRVKKIITINEELLVKMGLITWNGTTLQQLIDRCKVTEEGGKRITKIGGAGNAQGKYYVLCLHHIDPVDGDLWVMIVGRNTAGATLTLATDEGTMLEPEFTALPQDEDGTLCQLIEELPAA
jgi:hypothetical protein